MENQGETTRAHVDRPANIRVAIVTMDRHLAGATERAQQALSKDLPGLRLALHAASDWGHDEAALTDCRQDIARADIVIASMLFMEEHINPVIEDLRSRRDHCDAMVACMSAGEIVRLTRIGRLDMSAKQSGPMALLKRLKGERKKTGASSGAKQMAMLRRLPRILRYIPGTAQDLRAYFLTLQYWLASSDENLAGMVRLLINRYADGPRQGVRGQVQAAPPAEYPDNGLYHPRMRPRISEDAARLPHPPNCAGAEIRGRIGLLVMRSYVLAGDTGHYDGVIAALEARGYQAVPAFASGLDSTPTVERFFLDDNDTPCVDAVVSLTGFSLVGGPAYNDAGAAQTLLTRLDVPYLAAHALEFQSLDQWQASERGLMPVEATMMVAIPELDGATGSMVFGGRHTGQRDMCAHHERIERLAARVDRLARLRRIPAGERRLAITLFSFPPNAGNIGTAAFLSVWASLYETLKTLADQGYNVELPNSVDALREALVTGNTERYGTPANVHTHIPVDDHVAREPYLEAIEAQWGAAPGKQNSDGRQIQVLGAAFGNVLVAVQPSFGYEGDPMRLLFEGGFTPTHAFSAFYRYLREDFAADAVLHFGTHGALEFMPGKQTGLSDSCWPDRLIGDLPNFYLYAANNPSEASIAKRRSAATMVTYMTPPLAQAGLYKDLLDLKDSIERWRVLAPEADDERERLVELIQTQAAALDLAAGEPAWHGTAEAEIQRLGADLRELENTLIPSGLHVLGQMASEARRADLIAGVAAANFDAELEADALAELSTGRTPEAAGALTDDQMAHLARLNHSLADNQELAALTRALDGRFIAPVAGGDLIRTPDVLPTGRNLHGFDPFRLPSAFAVADGERQADLLLARYQADGHELPASIALVLWGTDNLKTEGTPIGQALALIGARPRHDSFGRIAGAELIPLAELGRARVDVLVTLSGIFRDLLPLQTRMLAEAAWLAAAAADEPLADNAVRRHTLEYQAERGCDFETAALRVFSNADGTYGSNVNMLMDTSRWESEDEFAETYCQRKCFAYGRGGQAVKQPELLDAALAHVELTYQNLESVELGVTTISHYMDTLGGISRAATRASGTAKPCYIGDQTRSRAAVRELSEQINLETRTRVLNPKWHEGMLEHGYEGVRQIEDHVTNTLGWSATNNAVAPWVYERISQTFVLDEAMRNRLAELNPTASARMTSRLLEAQERNYWAPDESMLDALRAAGDELEDRLEGIQPEVAPA